MKKIILVLSRNNKNLAEKSLSLYSIIDQEIA